MIQRTDEFRCDTNPDDDYLLVQTEPGFNEIWISVNEIRQGGIVMLNTESATRAAFAILGAVNRLRRLERDL